MSAAALLLLQLAAILFAARLCGMALKRFGQPAVIGEMVAGLLLGPLAFGAWLPEWHATLFAKSSLPPLSALATLGVTLFMFIVGAELRAPDGTRAQVRAALSIGLSGLALPFALGLAIAPLLHARLAADGIGFWPFALFLAAVMSVTALPVLARILKDRNLGASTPGRLALGAAMINDAFVWILLAAVLAFTGHGKPDGALLAVVGALALAATAFLLLKPLYARVLRPAGIDGQPAASAFGWVFAGLLGCAAFAEWIGLHAIFGAFLFGLCLPRDERLLRFLVHRIEPMAVTLLMPALFAVAGQDTTPHAFVGIGSGAFALILLVAASGKIAGCALGARLGGHGWRDSLAVGALMNARGLMELVAIKIGFDAGLIGPELFTLLFGMTLLTTLSASPLLSLFHRPTEPAGADAAGAAQGIRP